VSSPKREPEVDVATPALMLNPEAASSAVKNCGGVALPLLDSSTVASTSAANPPGTLARFE
jgi:hypothetical protein